jgi:hypothetical protein
MSKKIIRLTESDLVRIVRKVLNEQGVIGTLGGRTPVAQQRFNLSKSYPVGRTPRVMDDPTGGEPETAECRYKNLHTLVNECKKNEYKYKPDKDAFYIAKQLYDAMNGVSFGGAGFTIKYLEKDNATKFCKVSNAFKYDNQNLAQWIQDEYTLPIEGIWPLLKKHFNELNLGDECLKLNPNYS